ncbi:MAG TPA: type 4a pilus biogenesis protein PilO [Thermomonas sp.]|nr:type 4a pilus biogenesis protein PilO [Thermomonas sp.]
MSKKISLRELDINNIGAWPRNAKIGFCVILALLIIGLSWWLFVRDKRTELESLQRQETDLRTEFETKQGRAANLEPLKQQLVQMEQQLQQMLRQLPSKTEMPDLIVDISQTALATGIQNELFQPGPETPKEFYAEKPIALRMVGTYHQFGAFVSGVASLPRVVIMTMHDISLKPKDAKTDPNAKIGPNSALELAGTVKTYRYLDEEETAAQVEVEKQSAAKGGT